MGILSYSNSDIMQHEYEPYTYNPDRFMKLTRKGVRRYIALKKIWLSNRLRCNWILTRAERRLVADMIAQKMKPQQPLLEGIWPLTTCIPKEQVEM